MVRLRFMLQAVEIHFRIPLMEVSLFPASNIFSNLGVGVYDVEVREGLCNIIGGNYVFTDPSITIDSLNVTDDACNSSAQGEIEIFVSGGNVGVYNYSIDNGNT